ncbi:cbb3-type cytochrome oxidase assembly protein CcoS [Bosea vaviloviae]|uniref:Cytochrome oxidase maturation protein, cbb3-type n=1 Tax=Bosea vaviloviae TaxID=1526658 RepID=A0A1D7U383_9HYPH|nr:cytochrome oxidase maturation protein, cbb3-type [Bosea vaviloviae]
MSSLVFLVPLALLLGGAALAAFLWSLKSGQYEDLDGAAERILLDGKDDQIRTDERSAQPDQPTAQNIPVKRRQF